jgi:hypothetical protein
MESARWFIVLVCVLFFVAASGFFINKFAERVLILLNSSGAVDRRW